MTLTILQSNNSQNVHLGQGMIQSYKGVVRINSLSNGKLCSWSENNYHIDLIFPEDSMSDLLSKQRMLQLSKSLFMNEKTSENTFLQER